VSRVGAAAAGVALAIVLLSALARGAEWEGVKPGVSTMAQLRERLGDPLAEYPDSAVFRGRPGPQPIRIATVVAQLQPGGVVESLILFPEWGITNEDVREALGEGQTMTYAEFLRGTGRRVEGAGERPNTKLHYLNLDDRVEVFTRARVLVAYDDRDLSSGAEVVKLMLYY
jgi:hypothetical protein